MTGVLRDFQERGSDFLQSHDFALLLDHPGLGKSAQALDAADKIAVSRVLCLGPAVAGVSWPQQLKLWSPGRTWVSLDVGVTFGFDMPGFYFLSYDVLSQVNRRPLVRELATGCPPWDLLILDEAQYLKNPDARRTQAVYGVRRRPGIAANARRVWILSGTLTPNHAGEAFTHLEALFPAVLAPLFDGRVPQRYEFENRFCVVQDTPFGRQIRGSRRQKELRAALAPVVLRRLKQDVLRELPPIEFHTAPIIADRDEIDRLISAMMGADETAVPDDTVEDGTDLAVLATARRDLGVRKVTGCVQWITDRLTTEPKLIVFAHHRDVLVALHTALAVYSPVLLHGGTAPADRDAAVHQFQTNPSVRVFIGQIQAAGTAITLTAACTVFFVEFAATPGVNYQAACRAHRIGQHDGVQVYYGTVAGSLDERIASTAARRASEIAALFD